MPVNPASSCRTFVLVGLLAFAACGDGGGSSPPPNGPAEVSTLAYVVSRCHEEKGGRNSSFSQTLWIRQGNREPVKIAEFAGGQPAIGGLCHKWGQGRASIAAYLLGAVQRTRFTADGAQCLFEVTDDFSVNAHVIPEEQQGIFAVHTDGSNLRKIAPHSQDACFRVYWRCVFAPDAPECASCAASTLICGFGASPDGHRVSYTDLGPGPTGDAPQVFTLDLGSGQREQVTHLPPVPVSPACVGQDTDCVFPGIVPLSRTGFLGNATIRYERGRGCSTFGGGVFTVAADGTEEPQPVQTVALGGAVVPVFQITGEAYPAAATVPGIPVGGPGGIAGNSITEVFVIEPPDTAQLPGGRVLQLTNYHRSDTYNPGMSNDGQRVLFQASANPTELGTNPSNQCQLFSIDRLGSDLRQLTFLPAAGDKRRNCQDYAAPGCTLERGGVDMVTGSQTFASTCDPLGLNPTGADQWFAVRPDGSGLTQLTRTEGIVAHPDGSIDVEMARAFVPNRVR